MNVLLDMDWVDRGLAVHGCDTTMMKKGIMHVTKKGSQKPPFLSSVVYPFKIFHKGNFLQLYASFAPLRGLPN
ncbi:MAG: hypothetical protein JWR87_1365 [Segetibacter sp.]|jgi:hypothetical protein|nr:hypothetical protein [Segetibacter sp.]